MDTTLSVGIAISIGIFMIFVSWYTFEQIRNDFRERKQHFAELHAKMAMVEASNRRVAEREAERERLGLPREHRFLHTDV